MIKETFLHRLVCRVIGHHWSNWLNHGVTKDRFCWRCGREEQCLS